MEDWESNKNDRLEWSFIDEIVIYVLEIMYIFHFMSLTRESRIIIILFSVLNVKNFEVDFQ